MEIRKGMEIVTPDDQTIGHVQNIVIEPNSKTITHLVVERGFMFSEDRVMPLSWVMEVNDKNHIVLNDDHYDFGQLPTFTEKQYTRVQQEDLPPSDLGLVGAFGYYYLGAPGSAPVATSHGVAPAAAHVQYAEETVENIPDDEIALKIGAKVVSTDDDKVGNVEAIFTDSGNHVTHFVLSQGLLLKTRKLLPTSWIERVEENTVYLGVTTALLERLPEYEMK